MSKEVDGSQPSEPKPNQADESASKRAAAGVVASTTAEFGTETRATAVPDGTQIGAKSATKVAPDVAMPPSKLSTFVKVAGEYKELAVILVFFIGGIFWAFAYFATKQQLVETRCILKENVLFIQARMDASSLSQLLLDNTKESTELEKPNLTPEETLKRNRLKNAAADISRKLADAENAAAQALTKLKSGDCNPA
ncbi:hypothetical protein IVB30_00450 [Bradyrhizobium sp. 200]|uniref:hypothetical protein n=1 Tax=Bradyrhizobium sp. 200 TaxID=2782665 RepID=UPI001FFF06FE|nr:hypothetical protein [Bradyrhizobium sp. 200]UPJ49946.1 hypothetical protein IVB30_00450 [Bradyrhizobium sp. 200]